MKVRIFLSVMVMSALQFACQTQKINRESYKGSVNTSGYQADSLDAPHETPSSTNFSEVLGWPEGRKPISPPGFQVSKFADGLDHPRWIYVSDNGDVFVAESNTVLHGFTKLGPVFSKRIKSEGIGESANRIILFRPDQNGNSVKKYVFLDSLNQPFGMLIIGNKFFVGNTDGVIVYDYHSGDTVIRWKGVKILDLPAGNFNQHWTRNLITNLSRNKIYVAVGSGSNIANNGLEKEVRRANIIEINPDGTGEKIYASGLRNPVGMDWAPGTKVLWAAVNERDELGDELVPDYLTGVVQGGFYGWPFYYYGDHADPRMAKEMNKAPMQKVIVPDVPLGNHTASLGLVFYEKSQFPVKYRGGAFITQHGSWNRSIISGFKVIYVPFKDGRPSGKPQDFLTGFVADLKESKVYGRPVGIAVMKDGSMLVSDDASNTIWRISADKTASTK